MNGATDSFRLNQILQFPQFELHHDDVQSSCSICISNLTKGETILILPCLHKFHRSCIQTWLNESNTCPTCREHVIKDIADPILDEEISDVDVEHWHSRFSPIIDAGNSFWDVHFNSADDSSDILELMNVDIFSDLSSLDAATSDSSSSSIEILESSSSDESDIESHNSGTTSQSSENNDTSYITPSYEYASDDWTD